MANFEQLLADAEPAMADLARAARNLIRRVHPAAEEKVETAWGGYLLFQQVGTTVCWISTHKKHVSLGFPEGTELADPARLLEGTGKRMRHVKIKSMAALERPEVAALIAAAWGRQPEASDLKQALERLRSLCLSWPGTTEKLSHGHPTFCVGKKSFAVYGIYSPSVAFRALAGLALEGDDRFFPTPYMAKDGWMSVRLDGSVEWAEIEDLLRGSYELARASGKRR